jgi:hypothetical protein
MAGRNTYISQGVASEQNLIESLIIESLKIYGQNVFYIPRTQVAKDEILGEDPLSKFEQAFPIEMYFENVDNLGGQGPFIQKFGLFNEMSATLVVARSRWQELVGQHGNTFVPNRPNEGDLIYFPLTKGLFEIKFVQHQDPFYQLGKLYTFKMEVELFQYASEKIDTGIADIDKFEELKTFSQDPTRSENMFVDTITFTNVGAGYTTPPTLTFSGGTPSVTATNVGDGYNAVPTIDVSAPPAGGTQAVAVATIKLNVDKQGGFADNLELETERQPDTNEKVAWSENNPFGEF